MSKTIEIINVRDNGDYLTVAFKCDFGAEESVDIPVDTEAQKLNRIFLKTYNARLEKMNRKKQLLKSLQGSIELKEEPLEEAIQEAVKATENVIEVMKETAKTKIEELKEKVEQAVKPEAIATALKPETIVEAIKPQAIVEKIDEAIENIKTELGKIPGIDTATIQKIAELIKEKPDLKNTVTSLINTFKSIVKKEITEDAKEGIPETDKDFPWDVSK